MSSWRTSIRWGCSSHGSLKVVVSILKQWPGSTYCIICKHLTDHPHHTADAKERLDCNQSEKVHHSQRTDWVMDWRQITGTDKLVITDNSQAFTPWQIVAVREAIFCLFDFVYLFVF